MKFGRRKLNRLRKPGLDQINAARCMRDCMQVNKSFGQFIACTDRPQKSLANLDNLGLVTNIALSV